MIEEGRTEGMRRHRKHLAKEGRKPGPPPKLDPDEVKALRKQGLLIREIMSKVRASKASVCRALSA
ncbi:MAG: hypothetical protein AB7U75_07565 [Hyphomicrobiaceae bacterium]